MAEVDKLQIKIEAQAAQAFKNVDALTNRLRELARMSGTAAYGMQRLSGSFSSARKLGKDFSSASKGMEDFGLKLDLIFTAIIQGNRSLGRLNESMGKLASSSAQAKTASSNLLSIKSAAESVTKAVGSIAKATGKAISSLGRLAVSAARTVGSATISLGKSAFGALSGALSNTVGKLTGFFRGIVRIAKYRAIRAAIRAITDGLKTGIQNMYLWSQVVGTEFAPTMDRIATSMLYLKNGLGAMFSPLVEYFAPIIDQLVDTLVEAFNWVQRLFAELTGKSTWTKAIKVQTQYQENTDDTAESVRKLRQEIQLMDFDELNNITDNPDSGKGNGDERPNPDPAEMFRTEEMPIEPMEGTLWENIKKKLQEWLGSIGLWDENGFNWYQLGAYFGEAINWLWGKLTGWWNSIKWGEIFSSIIDFLDGLTDTLGLPDWITDGTFNWDKIGGDLGGALGKWLAEQDWEGIWSDIQTAVQGILSFTDSFVTEFIKAVFPEGAVDENDNINWGFVGETIGIKIGEWLNSIDWQALFQTVIDILKDIYDFLSGLIDGLLDELIPGRREAREQAERDAEAARTAHDNTEALREITGDGVGIGGGGHSFADEYDGSLFTDPDYFAAKVNEINETLRKLIPARRKLADQVLAMFTRSDGSFNEEEYNGAMALWEKRNGTLKEQELFWKTYEMSPTFAAFVDLQTEIENTDKLINGLEKDRKTAASKALVAMRKEAASFEVVSAAAEASGKRVSEYFNVLSQELPPYVSLITADAITTFEAADWKGGGEKAMAKLEKALKNAGIDDTTIELAKKSAMAFATEKGWATSGYTTATTIKDAVNKSNIPSKYREASRDALGAYLTGADWENGGQITVDGLKKAIKDSGPLVNTYSTAAARSIYGFMTGTYNGKGWTDAADETIRKMLLGMDKSKIPITYINAANDALTAYIAGIDWKRGGKASATGIKDALIAAGVPETYAKQAAASAAKWINSQDWKKSGITTGQRLATGVNDGLSGVKLKEVKIKAGIGSTSSDITKAINEKIKYASPKAIQIPHSVPVTTQALTNEVNQKIAAVNRGVTPLSIPVRFQHGKIDITARYGNEATDTRTLTYASGGYPRVGTMFVAGEAGAEFVGNINGKTGVASGQEITGIGDAVWSTGGRTAGLLEELINVVRDKNLTLSPSAALGRTVAQSQRLYARQTG